MNYLQRRNKAHLLRYDVARALGIDYWQYVEVEKGQRRLESQYLEKFVSICKNPQPLIKDRNAKLAILNAKIKDGTLEKRVEDFGYTVMSVGKALGYSHSVGYAVFRNGKVSDEIKLRVFDFLNDPMNKAVGKNFEFARKRAKNKSEVGEEVESTIPKEEEITTWVEEEPLEYFKDQLDEEITFKDENEENEEKEEKIETFNLEETSEDIQKQINTYKAVIEEQTKEIEILRMVIKTFEKLVSKL